MRIVIFGLTISSSWGNGHATLWRGLCKALQRVGHQVAFFERDVPYYANDRDWHSLPDGELVLYGQWQDVQRKAQAEVNQADFAIVTSYCPDAIAASQLIFDSPACVSVFYDLDTPVTLERLARLQSVPYIPSEGLGAFDLVLSYTGGAALDALQDQLGARRVAALYGHADPELHRPAAPVDAYAAQLSYLGTYSDDRQSTLETLFVEAARQRPQSRFLIGGAQYPDNFPWSDNIYFVRHVSPGSHPAFFSSSTLTLNVTRDAMVRMGWCPPGRMFEAAACGAALVSDEWEGLDAFYTPGSEIITANSTGAVLDALDMERSAIAHMAARARERTLDEHTSAHRAAELIQLLETLRAPSARPSTMSIARL